MLQQCQSVVADKEHLGEKQGQSAAPRLSAEEPLKDAMKTVSKRCRDRNPFLDFSLLSYSMPEIAFSFFELVCQSYIVQKLPDSLVMSLMVKRMYLGPFTGGHVSLDQLSLSFKLPVGLGLPGLPLVSAPWPSGPSLHSAPACHSSAHLCLISLSDFSHCPLIAFLLFSLPPRVSWPSSHFTPYLPRHASSAPSEFLASC